MQSQVVWTGGSTYRQLSRCAPLQPNLIYGKKDMARLWPEDIVRHFVASGWFIGEKNCALMIDILEHFSRIQVHTYSCQPAVGKICKMLHRFRRLILPCRSLLS